MIEIDKLLIAFSMFVAGWVLGQHWAYAAAKKRLLKAEKRKVRK